MKIYQIMSPSSVCVIAGTISADCMTSAGNIPCTLSLPLHPYGYEFLEAGKIGYTICLACMYVFLVFMLCLIMWGRSEFVIIVIIVA